MEEEEKQNNHKLPRSIIVGSLIISAALIYHGGLSETSYQKGGSSPYKNDPATESVELPIAWSDIGEQLVQAGVIDKEKFRAIYAGEKDLDRDVRILLGEETGTLKVNEQNAHAVLNFLWAFGLSNKNKILEEGPMADPRYGGTGPPAGGFASTGGWTLGEGSAMNHYSIHQFVELSGEQQKLVEKVSKNIYRPCCGNATHFPDCNHGMAMLGLLEILAAEGASESTMYKAALSMNKLWFPDHYVVIGQYLKDKGQSIDTADAKEILGKNYSSAAGYSQIESQVIIPEKDGGGENCSV